MMNCGHSDDGWCLPCVAAMGEECARLRGEIEQLTKERDAARLALRLAEEHVTVLVRERDAARAEVVELARHATIHTKHRAPDCTPASCTKCLAERVLAALAAGAKEEKP